jgi:hypothetical protein
MNTGEPRWWGSRPRLPGRAHPRVRLRRMPPSEAGGVQWPSFGRRRSFTLAPVVFLFLHASAAGDAGAVGDDLAAVGRFVHDVPYTTAVATPHVNWAAAPGRLAGQGPIRVFTVASVRGGRDVVELAQRLDLALTTVTVDPDWRLNVLGLSDHVLTRGAREGAAQAYRVTDDYLRLYAAGARRYDCYVIPSGRGWNAWPEDVRRAIRHQVTNGAGLVLINPLSAKGGEEELAELSPLVESGSRPAPETEVVASWRVPEGRASHYIARGVPVGRLPAAGVRCPRYRAVGEVVLETASGDPLVAVRTVGRGRVVAFAYESDGLAPKEAESEGSGLPALHMDRGFEAAYSLLCRAIVWAARRETDVELRDLALDPPTVRPGLDREASLTMTVASLSAAGEVGRSATAPVTLRVTVRNEQGRETLTRSVVVSLPAGGRQAVRVPVPATLAGGVNGAEVVLSDGVRTLDWGMAPVRVEQRAIITDVEMPKVFYEQGEAVAGKVSFAAAPWDLPSSRPAIELEASVIDRFGRVLARETADERAAEALVFSLRPRASCSAGAVLRLALRVNGQTAHQVERPISFRLPRPEEDLTLVVDEPEWERPPMRWRGAVDGQLQRLGVSAIVTASPARAAGTLLRVEALLPEASVEDLPAAARRWTALSPLAYQLAAPAEPSGRLRPQPGGGRMGSDPLMSFRWGLTPFSGPPADRSGVASPAWIAERRRALREADAWAEVEREPFSAVPLVARPTAPDGLWSAVLLRQSRRVLVGWRFGLLNPDFAASEAGREWSAAATALRGRGLARLLLSAARVAAPAEGPVLYRDGGARYLASVGAAPAVALDRFWHAYDSLGSEYLGWTAKIADHPADGPRVVALLPYRVTGLAIDAPPTRVGGTISVTVRLSADGGAEDGVSPQRKDIKGADPVFPPRGGLIGRHVVAVDVIDPGGRTRPEYHLNLDGHGGVLRGSVPLALNDPAGTWTLRARDAATGFGAATSPAVRD